MVPPVPIPNTVVKHSYAESTCLETDWEDRALPVKRSTREGAFFVLLDRFTLATYFAILIELNFCFIFEEI